MAGLGVPVLEVAGENGIGQVEDSDLPQPADNPAMILYTRWEMLHSTDIHCTVPDSGTTGKPKGVVLSHGNLRSQADCLVAAWQWQQQDHLLHCLPLHHTHGIVNCLLCPLTVPTHLSVLKTLIDC